MECRKFPEGFLAVTAMAFKWISRVRSGVWTHSKSLKGLRGTRQLHFSKKTPAGTLALSNTDEITIAEHRNRKVRKKRDKKEQARGRNRSEKRKVLEKEKKKREADPSQGGVLLGVATPTLLWAAHLGLSQKL